MKELLKMIYTKYKKIILIAASGLALIIIGNFLWNVYFVKIKIFKQQEKLFSETVQKYYEYRSQLLPKKGESRTMTLQELYDKDLIEDLYIPKTQKTCDVNMSRVRIYQNENGEYIYNTYLKCGKYESKVDYAGPQIILNGEDEEYVALNSEYVDPGVKEVFDNKDGKIDASKVIVDKSDLNTKKIGTYKITYTISDSAYNKTVKTRKIKVRENLTTIVKNDTKDTKNYYTTGDSNNYVIFSGYLWRIVNVNEDGSIKLVTDTNISMLTYGKKDTDYKNSNIREWLNNLFYNSLTDDNKYIVEDAKWCVDKTDDIKYKSDTCKETITDKVGLLSLSDYNKTIQDELTFLDEIYGYYLITQNSKNDVYANVYGYQMDTSESDVIRFTRPSIVLKSNLYVLGGDGTQAKPYRLGDYKIGSKDDYLNTRLIGEYVDYSGMVFRISGFDEDKNIQLTTVATLAPEGKIITVAYGSQDVVGLRKDERLDDTILFDPKNETSIGYKLNNELINYIDENFIVKHKYSVYQLDTSKKYNELKVKKNFEAKLSIPSSFDLFSAVNRNIAGDKFYYLLDYINDYEYLLSANREGSVEYNSIKLVIYIKKDSKIKKGIGTANNPFYIK